MYQSAQTQTNGNNGGGGDTGTASTQELKGTTHAQGTAAVSAARVRTTGLLTAGQEREAVKYNKRRGFSRAVIQGYQNVVNTPDDGDFGPNTVEAIARFQQSHGLEHDGKIGPRTQESLDALRKRPNDPKPEDNKPPANDPPVKDGGLTANFSLAEFASHDGAATPRSVIPALKELAQNLEVLRTAAGAGIHITSGYRSPAHNAAVGGARNSMHMKGEAADITISGMTPSQIKAKIESLIKTGKMKQGGVGLYSSFIHYDTRGYAARW